MRCAVRSSAKADEKHGRGVPGVVRRAVLVGRFLRLHVLGPDQAAHDAQLAVMGDADDGPSPRLLPVAPYEGAFGESGDFFIEGVEACDLVGPSIDS